MSKRVRVNISTAINASQIKRERRDGRDVLIVPSATLPDNIVMNRMMYPADEIAKSYHTLERTPAPLGHPSVNGRFVSAKDPEGLARGWIGAWNEKVRRDNGRVYLDKVIDIAVARQSDGGQAVLEAIEKGEPVHTSTGLYCLAEDSANSEYDYIAREIVFDHDAILLGEAGAATPAQGVGMMVNKAVGSDGKDVEVINSALDIAEDNLDWAGMHLLDSFERLEKASRWEQFKTKLLELLSKGKGIPETEQGDESMNDAQYKDLDAKVNTLAENQKTVNESLASIANSLKSLVDHQTAVVNSEKEKKDAEKAVLVNAVVKANLLTEAVANTLTIEALTELSAKAKPGKAAAISNGVELQTETKSGGFKLPAAS